MYQWYSLLMLLFLTVANTASGQSDQASPIQKVEAVAVKKDALWHLRQAPQPVFKQGHTLLPLTRWGWSMSYPVKIELCERWGYALEFSEPKTANLTRLDNPESEESRLCALATSDPAKYPLAVLVPRPLGNRSYKKTLPPETWCHDEKGDTMDAPAWKTWSPEAPDKIYQQAAQQTVELLAKVKAKAPIAILLNGGEFGQGVLGHSQKYWSQDPKILAAKGNRDWFTYISQRKAQKEIIIAQAVRDLFPDRSLYLWYHFGCMPGLLSQKWTFDYDATRPLSDMPGQSLYYKHFNSGWTGKNDLLSRFTASVALTKPYGDIHSYNWLCAGWKRKGHFSDRDRYMGFLKCLYTAGQVGAVAGYFSRPKGGFKRELGDEIPSWLWQMMDLAQAQALFTHLEDMIRNGDLLPGPGKNRISSSIPAYEFPTGDLNARVLVRKHRTKEQWLITAWAAKGPARKVVTSIPNLGDITVLARPSGSVYLGHLKQALDHEPPVPVLKLIDTHGMYPSGGFAQK